MSRSIEDLRSSVRALDRKIDNYHMEFAELVGILPLKQGRKFWILGELDINDSRIPDDQREKYLQIVRKRYDLNKQVEKYEAIKNNDVPRWEASEIAYGFLNILGEDGNQWLIDHKLNTLTLTEAILQNPKFLEEVCL